MWRLLLTMAFVGILSSSCADVYSTCLRQTPNCSHTTISCESGMIKLENHVYRMTDNLPNQGGQCCQCCNKNLADCTMLYAQDLIDKLKENCSWKHSCELPADIFRQAGGSTYRDNGNCKGYYFSSTRIEYNCVDDNQQSPLTGRESEDDEDIMLAVVIPITIALIVLGIVVIVLGTLLYRRKTMSNNINKPERNSNIEDIRRDQDNVVVDEDYNTIPADYDEIPQNSYLKLNDNDTEKAYSAKVSIDGATYSTIVLDNDIDKSASANKDYDKTQHRKTYDITVNNASEDLHSYGHLDEMTGDYNTLQSSNNGSVMDADYSHVAAEALDDYSHLNNQDKNLNKILNSDYNRLQVNNTRSRSSKLVDSYEQHDLETPTAEIMDVSMNEPQENSSISKRRDSYELPSSFNHPDNSLGGASKTHMLKRIDSYETPVLKHNEPAQADNGHESNINADATEGIHRTQMAMNMHRRFGSYEQPILKNIEPEKSGELKKDNGNDNTSPYSGSAALIDDTEKSGKYLKARDDYEIPVLKTNEISEDDTTNNSTHET